MNESVIKSINIRRNVEFQNLMMLHLRHKRSNYLETMQAYLYHNKDGMYKVPCIGERVFTKNDSSY